MNHHHMTQQVTDQMMLKSYQRNYKESTIKNFAFAVIHNQQSLFFAP